MKLVLFNSYCPYPPKGGGDLRIWKLVEALVNRDFDVHIVCLDNVCACSETS